MKNWSGTENRRLRGETGTRADRVGARAGRRWRAGALALLVAGVVGAILAGPAAAATLKGDYRFQDSLSSSFAGPLPLSNIEIAPCCNAFATETVDGSATRVLTFPKRNGVSFTTTGQISSDAYSTVFKVRLGAVTGYRRLLEAKGDTTDRGLYYQDGLVNFFDDSINLGAGPVVLADEYAEIAFTRNDAKEVNVYVNGELRLTHDDPADHSKITAGVLRFFSDGTVDTFDEDSAGAVSRIRIYDGALSAAEVAAINNPPADSTPPPDTTAATDTTAANIALKGNKTQKGFKVVKVKVSSDEAGTVTSEGTIKVPVVKGGSSSAIVAKKKKSKLKGQIKEIAAGETVTLKLKLTKKARKLTKRAQRKGKKPKAKVTVTVTDAAGNESQAKRTVKLKK